jgi:transmembrane sensor
MRTAKGERKTFALADASTVTLNTDSAVAVAYRPAGERRLELIRGQAFFIAAHDKARPFVVSFRGRTVTALGTAFEVRGVGDAMRVILVEGRVSVRRAGGAPVVMHPGQQLLADARRFTLSPIEIAEAAEWRRGLVTFRDTTLKDAVAEFNRYADRPLVITDPRVAQLTVSGVFRTDDSARFARTVAAVLPVRVVAAQGEALELVPSKGSAPADSRR